MAETMDFTSLAGEATPAASTPKKDANEAFRKELVAQYAEQLQGDPEAIKNLYSAVDTLRVVNTFGYGESGGIIEAARGNKNAAPGEKTGRQIASTSKIYGCIVENVGTTPIQYTHGVWTKNAEGVYEETVVDDVINPGERKPLATKYMVVLLARPEFSLKCANGRMTGSPKRGVNSIDDVVGEYSFKFRKDAGMSVHDDNVKIAIADKVEVNEDGQTKAVWVIKPEYEAEFGFLNNPKVSSRRTKTGIRKANIDIDSAAIANYLNNLVHNTPVK